MSNRKFVFELVPPDQGGGALVLLCEDGDTEVGIQHWLPPLEGVQNAQAHAEISAIAVGLRFVHMDESVCVVQPVAL